MINLFIGLRDDLDLEDAKIGRILSHPDLVHFDRMMKRKTLGGNEWRLYSVYIEPSSTSKAQIQNWLNNNSTRVIVAGAWNWNGLQVGTSINGAGDIVGSPLYPVDARLISFMPDDVSYDSDGVEVIRTLAVALKDVNLILGQRERVF